MTTTVSVELEDATLAALDRLADDLRSPRDNLVARAVENLVAHEAWLTAKIDAAVASAEAGDFAPEVEVARVRTSVSRSGRFRRRHCERSEAIQRPQ